MPATVLKFRASVTFRAPLGRLRWLPRLLPAVRVNTQEEERQGMLCDGWLARAEFISGISDENKKC